MMHALLYRSGRATGARPKFQRHCNDAWTPLNALVVFLPMQLALFLTVKYREFAESGGTLSDTSVYPSVVIEKDDPTELSSTGNQGNFLGRAFKGNLKLTGPPLWPRDTGAFPFTVPESAQQTIASFCAKRKGYSPKDFTSLQAQVNLEPRAMSLKFHLAELPAQADMSNASCTQQYTSNKSQSGPLSLHKRLCNEFAKDELSRLCNFTILTPKAESTLTSTVDSAFPLEEPPEKKSRSNVNARSSGDARPRHTPATSSDSTSEWRHSDWSHGWSYTAWSKEEWKTEDK
jgi:hypothetical protein